MAKVPSYWTVLSMLEWATEYFEERNIPSPRMSIEWLLADVLDIRRLDLYLKFDRPLSTEELDQLRPMVKRRAGHEPLQYITGETDFMDCRIHVEPGVLIPRPETEQLVEHILQEHSGQKSLRVIDLGTGSGCIPIALKKARPDWEILATDISEAALRIAKENARNNDTHITFIRDDFRESRLEDRYDIVISNPPYIEASEKEDIEPEVKDFEPELALFCNSTKEVFSNLAQLSGQLLRSDGSGYLEISEFRAAECSEIFEQHGFRVRLKKDYGKKERFLIFGQ